jgi:hypothetical protein
MINLKIDLNQAKFLYAASQSATIQGKDAIFVANIISNLEEAIRKESIPPEVAAKKK